MVLAIHCYWKALHLRFLLKPCIRHLLYFQHITGEPPSHRFHCHSHSHPNGCFQNFTKFASMRQNALFNKFAALLQDQYLLRLFPSHVAVLQFFEIKQYGCNQKLCVLVNVFFRKSTFRLKTVLNILVPNCFILLISIVDFPLISEKEFHNHYIVIIDHSRAIFINN